MPQEAVHHILVSPMDRAGHTLSEQEDTSIHLPARAHAWFLAVLCATAMLAGCSGDRSLGSGLPPSDAAIALDTPETSILPLDAGTERGSVCIGRGGSDAGAGLTSRLLAWYRCEAAAGASAASLPDSTGSGRDGTLVSQAGGPPGYSFGPGRIGNALDLSYAQQGHVALPAGLLADACEVTIATWVYPNSNDNAWMRVWDFGQDTTTYMFLTSSTNYDDRFAKFAITVGGRFQEESITAPAAIPPLVWTHVALVLGPAGATLYFDGAPVVTSDAVTLRPADLGRTANNYIGRSQFSDDPYLDGDIDEFRIYDRALSQDEIQALANGLE